MTDPAPRPARTLSVADAVFVAVGIVIGAGIFRAPSLVAANSSGEIMMVLLWVAGGVIALIGALCYAELASAYPSAGGDYHFIQRAFGRSPSFLFAWARLAVMQTGSIALLAFVFGDYAAELAPIGPNSSAIYAAFAIAAFTVVNLLGIRQGTGAQWIFTSLEVIGVFLVIVAGLAFVGGSPEVSAAPVDGRSSPQASLGLAMVFVLLTYGGWNEAAYVSAEMKGSRAPLARALILSIAIITVLYVLINIAYVRVLGLEGMAASEAVAADTMRLAFGENGARLVSLLVAISALTSINATIITGARCNYAVGRDFPMFAFLGRWNASVNTPTAALIVQGIIALLLVLIGMVTRTGFATLVEFTAPVFWFFFLLAGLALFRLRRKEPHAERPFRVPLYPLTPILFCLSSAYMLWSSLNYTGWGALAGVAVLLAGLPVLWIMRRRESIDSGGQTHAEEEPSTRVAREHRVVD